MPYRTIGLLCFVVFLVTMGVRRGYAAEPQGSGKMVFSHIGIITTEKKPGERFVPATRVWVTDFQNHPFHVEWLRFEPDSPVTGPVRNMPHVAYKVDSIKEASKGMKELLAPFEAGIAIVGFYQSKDGAVVEFMEMKPKCQRAKSETVLERE
jgi:hypothetical protein